MEKEAHGKSKISHFPPYKKREKAGKWEETFRRQLCREAEEWEAELEEKPELADVDAPPELFDRIVGKLKEEGKWEAELSEELTPDIYSLLPEKDREALDIGRRVQKKGKRRYARRWFGAAAAVVFCVFVAAMSSEANRKYAVGVINTITGSKWGVYVEDVDGDTIKYSEDERTAYQDIEEKLGIPVPQMQYKPYGMEFQDYQVSEDRGSGSVFYQYNDSIITLHLYGCVGDSTMQQTLDAHLIGEIQMDALELPVKLYELEEKGEVSYAGEILYNDCYYVILGKMEKNEFQKVLENIVF